MKQPKAKIDLFYKINFIVIIWKFLNIIFKYHITNILINKNYLLMLNIMYINYFHFFNEDFQSKKNV